jgi:thiol-disulfide isomerase/thioredoxin
MGRINKIKFLVFLVLIPTFCNAEIKPPFKNISVSKNPIYYQDILFEDFDGKIINLKQKNSKIYVLNFWATWCLPCKEEMPYLDELQLNKSIEVFPINVEVKNQLNTLIFFKNLKIKNLSIFFDSENKLVNLFRLRGLPTTIILNSDKNEIARILGAVNFSDERFIKWIESILD